MAEFKYNVTIEEAGKPLKEIVKSHFSFSSRLMTKLRQQDLIKVNGVPVPGWVAVSEGDTVSVSLPDEKSDYTPENIPVNVVYEDDDILVINKQPGHVVHPTKGKPYHTMANAIMYKMLVEAGAEVDENGIPLFDTADESKLYKIRFVNRLDMNTSGLVIVAKNSHSQDNLEKQMKTDDISKRYMALVEGIIAEDEGTINAPLGRPDPEEVERWIVPEENGGFPSITHFRVIGRYEMPHKIKDSHISDEENPLIDGYSLVELRLETGRTHQIRVHMANMGHPVVGDHLYCHGNPFEYRAKYGDPRPPKDGTPGPRETNPEVVSDIIDRQALHAYRLDFKHPITGEQLSLTADLPEDMTLAISKITKN